MNYILVLIKKHKFKFAGFLCYIFVLRMIDIRKVGPILKNLDYYPLVMISVFILFISIIKPYRWVGLLRVYGVQLRLYESIILYNSAILLGTFTPGNIGEFVKIYFLNKMEFKNSNTLTTTWVCFIDRGIDIFFLLSICSFSLLCLTDAFLLSLSSFAIVSSILIVLLYLYRIQIACFVSKSFYIKRILKTFGLTVEKLIVTMRSMPVRSLLFASFLTVIAWIVYFWLMWLIFGMINLEISIHQLLLVISVSTLIGILPISFSGVGTREISLIYLFPKIGLEKEYAIVFSVMIILFYIYVNTFYFFSYLFLDKILTNKSESTASVT